MRVIVAGAVGHIGTNLVTMLVDAGHDVVTITRHEPRPYELSPAWARLPPAASRARLPRQTRGHQTLLADHFAFAMKRQEKGMHVTMPLSYDAQTNYPVEYQLGLVAIRGIERTFGVRLPREGATGIAHQLQASHEGDRGDEIGKPLRLAKHERPDRLHAAREDEDEPLAFAYRTLVPSAARTLPGIAMNILGSSAPPVSCAWKKKEMPGTELASQSQHSPGLSPKRKLMLPNLRFIALAMRSTAPYS